MKSSNDRRGLLDRITDLAGGLSGRQLAVLARIAAAVMFLVAAYNTVKLFGGVAA